MSVKFPDFTVDGNRMKTSEGRVQPASPELQAMAAIYQVLSDIKERLDAPVVNYTNHPPSTTQPKK